MKEQVKITAENPIQAGDVLENDGVVRLCNTPPFDWVVELPSGSMIYFSTEHFIGFTVTRDIKPEIVSGERFLTVEIVDGGDEYSIDGDRDVY